MICRLCMSPVLNIITDPMSRLSVSSNLLEVIDDGKDYIGMLSVEAVPYAMLGCEIQVGSDFCPDIQTIKEAITQGKWEKCSVNLKVVKDELSVSD